MENTPAKPTVDKKALWKTILVVLITFIIYKAFTSIVSHINGLDALVSLFIRETWMLICALGAAAYMKKLGTLKLTGKGFGTGILVGLWFLIAPTLSLIVFIAGRMISVSGLGVVLFVIAMVFVGLGEELLFRGVLLEGCMDAYGEGSVSSIRKAIVVSGVIFGCLHLFNFLNGAAIGSTLIQAIGNIPAGILLGAIYVRSKKNLWPGVVLHAYNDFCGFAASGLLMGYSANDAISSYNIFSFIQCAMILVIAIIVLRKKKVEPLVKAPEAAEA